MSCIVQFFDTDVSATELDETGVASTYESFLLPTGSNQSQTVLTYMENIGDVSVDSAIVRAMLTSYVDSGITDLPAWLDNIARNILPRIQFSNDGVTFLPMGRPIGSLPLIVGGGRVPLYVRYTSVLTDVRTGLDYDYSAGANLNDYPYAFALFVGSPTGHSYGQVVG
jgi:hypothetical protein